MTERRQPESLEQTIRRVTTDAAAVRYPLTPRTLAVAISGAGWHHDRAPVTTGPPPTRERVTTKGNTDG